MSVWSRIVNVFRSDRLNSEIEDEFEAHIAEAVEQGRDPNEARKALGASTRQRQESHDARVVGWLDSLRADLVFGWRQLKRNKVTSIAAILSLALAIGACTSAFRLIDALLWRPLPVEHPERLYVLSKGVVFEGKFNSFDSWAYPAFVQMRAAAKNQAELIAISYTNRADVTYKTDQEMEKANLQHVSGWMFSTFGIGPALGRLFTENDDLKPGAAPYAVLSYDYWSRRFGRDPNVVGRTFHFGDGIYQIIGVSEKKFTGTEPGTVVDIFIPTMMHPAVARSDWSPFRTLVVMKPDVAVEPLREKLEAISHAFEANRLSGETGLFNETLRNLLLNFQLLMKPAPTGASEMQKDYNRALTALGMLVLMVLLIACANVANLMTAQAAARAREMALRVSIGAGRWRLVQMVLVESALLAFLAAASGALFAWWSAPFVVSMINPPDNPVRLILPADWRVLGFGMALTLGVVLLFGLLPALRASSVKPVSILKGGDDPHSRQRLMHGMIALQVAFCFLVLFVAGLFVATFQRLSHKPTGFSSERILLLESTSQPEQPSLYWDQVAEHLRGAPGVERVSQAGWPLLEGVNWSGPIIVNGGSPSKEFAYFLNVSPGWLETMKIPLVAGRDFRENDAYPDAAIVNETFAREFLNTEDPIGRSFEKPSHESNHERMRVVGVVRDASYRDIHDPMLPVVYVPLHSHDEKGIYRPLKEGTFIVRTTAANPLAMASTLRQEVSRARSEFRDTNVRTQQELNQAQTIRERLLATLAFFFGAVALLLAGVGLYGVLNYSVQQREREIGIRMALGAQAADVARRIMAGISLAVGVGAVAGLALGLSSVRYIESLLYQVNATDTAVLAIPCLTILAAVLIAAIPAVIRALRIDPVAMLRVE